MATKQHFSRESSNSSGFGLTSLLEEGFEYEAGEEVTVKVNGEVKPARVESRMNGPIRQIFFREGSPEYEVRVLEYDIDADDSAQNDYEVEVKVDENNLYRQVVAEDDIL